MSNSDARQQALALFAAFKFEPTSLISYQSAGKVLALGDESQLQQFTAPDSVEVQSIAVKPGAVQIQGHLGAYVVEVSDKQGNQQTHRGDAIVDLSETPLLGARDVATGIFPSASRNRGQCRADDGNSKLCAASSRSPDISITTLLSALIRLMAGLSAQSVLTPVRPRQFKVWRSASKWIPFCARVAAVVPRYARQARFATSTLICAITANACAMCCSAMPSRVVKTPLFSSMVRITHQSLILMPTIICCQSLSRSSPASAWTCAFRHWPTAPCRWY